jgi:hypothetical protein
MFDAQVAWDVDDDPDGNVQHIAENDPTVDEGRGCIAQPSRNFFVNGRLIIRLSRAELFTGIAEKAVGALVGISLSLI